MEVCAPGPDGCHSTKAQQVQHSDDDAGQQQDRTYLKRQCLRPELDKMLLGLNDKADQDHEKPEEHSENEGQTLDC